MNYLIGIDPGKGGASVVLSVEGVVRDIFEFSKGGESGFLEFARVWSDKGALAVMEKVSAMPKQGVASTFKFGDNTGFLRGVVMGNGIPLELVLPATWQKGLMLPKVPTKTKHKANLKDVAARVYPGHKWTLATCDAFLIARWGLEHYRRNFSTE